MAKKLSQITHHRHVIGEFGRKSDLNAAKKEALKKAQNLLEKEQYGLNAEELFKKIYDAADYLLPTEREAFNMLMANAPELLSAIMIGIPQSKHEFNNAIAGHNPAAATSFIVPYNPLVVRSNSKTGLSLAREEMQPAKSEKLPHQRKLLQESTTSQKTSISATSTTSTSIVRQTTTNPTILGSKFSSNGATLEEVQKQRDGKPNLPEDFLQMRSSLMSNNNSTAIASNGAAGLFGMTESDAVNAGIYTAGPSGIANPNDPNKRVNNWDGRFTGKYGINSLEDFLKAPDVQKIVEAEVMKNVVIKIKDMNLVTGTRLPDGTAATKLSDFSGQTIGGIKLELSAMINAFRNPLGSSEGEDLRVFCESGGRTNNNKVSDLLKVGNGYNLPSLVVKEAQRYGFKNLFSDECKAAGITNQENCITIKLVGNSTSFLTVANFNAQGMNASCVFMAGDSLVKIENLPNPNPGETPQLYYQRLEKSTFALALADNFAGLSSSQIETFSSEAEKILNCLVAKIKNPKTPAPGKVVTEESGGLSTESIIGIVIGSIIAGPFVLGLGAVVCERIRRQCLERREQRGDVEIGMEMQDHAQVHPPVLTGLQTPLRPLLRGTPQETPLTTSTVTVTPGQTPGTLPAVTHVPRAIFSTLAALTEVRESISSSSDLRSRGVGVAASVMSSEDPGRTPSEASEDRRNISYGSSIRLDNLFGSPDSLAVVAIISPAVSVKDGLSRTDAMSQEEQAREVEDRISEVSEEEKNITEESSLKLSNLFGSPNSLATTTYSSAASSQESFGTAVTTPQEEQAKVNLVEDAEDLALNNFFETPSSNPASPRSASLSPRSRSERYSE